MFEVPEALRGEGRNYSVIRVHGDETTVLPDKDNDLNTVTIETDKFSTYALAYSEKATVTPPGADNPIGNDPTTPDENTTGNGDPSDNEITSPNDVNSSTDDSGINSDDGTSSSNENNSAPSESASADNSGNPSTGIAISFVPLAAAVTVLTVTVKRKKK